MELKVSEVQEVFRDMFSEDEDARASSVDIVYEVSSDQKFYKMVVSIQGLETEDVSIIHTKFIFKDSLFPLQTTVVTYPRSNR